MGDLCSPGTVCEELGVEVIGTAYLDVVKCS
jgi:hypothetical protein